MRKSFTPTPIPPSSDRYREAWLVNSESSDSVYVVTTTPKEQWACSCPHWTRHFPRPTCKHIRRVQEYRTSAAGMENRMLPVSNWRAGLTDKAAANVDKFLAKNAFAMVEL